MNLTGIESLGYSSIDWELAKRKGKDPEIKFEDILKEKMLMYESPIEKIYGDMELQMVKQDEENVIYSVNQAVGYKVDRDELLKALEYDRGQYQKGFDDGRKLMSWIPVAERLPEIGQRVLVTAYGRVCYAKRIDHYEYGYAVFKLQDSLDEKTVLEVVSHEPYSTGRIDAWMPLPEPYKAEENLCDTNPFNDARFGG